MVVYYVGQLRQEKNVYKQQFDQYPSPYEEQQQMQQQQQQMQQQQQQKYYNYYDENQNRQNTVVAFDAARNGAYIQQRQPDQFAAAANFQHQYGT